MRAVRLTEEEITERLARLPGWTRAGQTVSRTFAFGSFAEAMRFVGKVADEAERVDHHPDIDIRYDKVTVALTTHFLKALTQKDMDLAGVCERLAEEARL